MSDRERECQSEGHVSLTYPHTMNRFLFSLILGPFKFAVSGDKICVIFISD